MEALTKNLGKQAHPNQNASGTQRTKKTHLRMLYITLLSHSQQKLKSRAPLNRFAQHCLTLITQPGIPDV